MGPGTRAAGPDLSRARMNLLRFQCACDSLLTAWPVGPWLTEPCGGVLWAPQLILLFLPVWFPPPGDSLRGSW